MQKLTFINARGAEITFDFDAPYIFWKISGIELPPVEPVYTQAAAQDGYTLHSILLESRTIKLSGHIHGKNAANNKQRMYEARKKLNSICNPLLGAGTLIYENDAGKWRIPAFCNGNPYGNKLLNIQTLDVSFECPSPFWLSYEEGGVGLAYISGGLSFPLRFPTRFSMLGYRALIDNDGDTDMPLEFFIGGGSKNPIIRNKTTGEYILVDKQMSEFDRLYINTEPEKLEVSLYTLNPETNAEDKENAYGYLSFDSTPFMLPVGVNDIVFTSDDENKKVKIRIVYRKRYAGV